jgi:hypothetical protein
LPRRGVARHEEADAVKLARRKRAQMTNDRNLCLTMHQEYVWNERDVDQEKREVQAPDWQRPNSRPSWLGLRLGLAVGPGEEVNERLGSTNVHERE